jgi:4-hydroxymandelate oxidase
MANNNPLIASSIDDYKKLAAERLPPGSWDYLQAGCGKGLTLSANETVFDQLNVMPRPLADVGGGDTRITLFGQALAHPLMLAPVAYQRLFHAEGEQASAMAAEAQLTPMIVSSLASQILEDIASTGALLWFQLYWQGSREESLRLLRRAEAAGCKAIVFTVDAPVKQASLNLPAEIRAVNLADSSQNQPPTLSPEQSAVFDYWMQQAPGWKAVSWLRQQTTLPLLIKGLLHPDDAERALAAGCDGVIVSNHGGRVLDGAPASLDALPAIVSRVNGRAPVLFDSGIRSGSDIFKALSLGASSVLVGRPYIWGLAVQGALGVAHVIRLLRDELEMTMALTGHASVASVGAQQQRISS